MLCGVCQPEGPFGEYTGYMSESGDTFVIRVDAITHRDKPIFHDFFSQMQPPRIEHDSRPRARNGDLQTSDPRLGMPVADVHLLHAGDPPVGARCSIGDLGREAQLHRTSRYAAVSAVNRP